MKNWNVLKDELLSDKQVHEEYSNLEPRYQLSSQVIKARLDKGVTQEQLARMVGTKQSAIARLESGNTNPSLAFVEKITKALGSKLVIALQER